MPRRAFSGCRRLPHRRGAAAAGSDVEWSAGDRPGLRLFSLSLTARNQTVTGDLLLDGEGRLVEQTILGETTRRAD